MKAVTIDFFVIGVARGGTTSLYHYLQQHPQLFLPKVKECNYFTNAESLDKEVYNPPIAGEEYHMKIIRSKEVYNQLFQEATQDQIKGEVSPAYLWDPTSAKRIYDHNPNAKIIVSLRDPIQRAYSHYLMHYHTGYDKAASFEAALEAPKKEIWGGGNMYLEMGLYYSQLKPYFDLFDPKNIKVVVSEEWTKENGEALNDIYRFLNVDAFSNCESEETFNASVQVKNKGLLDFLRSEKIKRSLNRILPKKTKEKLMEHIFYKESEKQPLDQNTRENLKEYFMEDVSRTGDLIGRDLGQLWEIN